MLTRQDVRSAYKLILGRDPESETIVDNFVQYATFDSLRAILLGSVEFAERLKTDPKFSGISATVCQMNHATRFHSRRLEHLESLGLPIWGRSVLISGPSAGASTSFFADRLCAVTIVDQSESCDLLTAAMPALTSATGAANVSIRNVDMSAIAGGAGESRYQIVYADAPRVDSDSLLTWLTNMAYGCSELMVFYAEVAPGHTEEMFTAYHTDEGQRTTALTIPTRLWLMRRLQERFNFVYLPATQPNHEYFPLDWRRGWALRSGGQYAIFVAARAALDQPKLSRELLQTQTHDCTHVILDGDASIAKAAPTM